MIIFENIFYVTNCSWKAYKRKRIWNKSNDLYVSDFMRTKWRIKSSFLIQPFYFNINNV